MSQTGCIQNPLWVVNPKCQALRSCVGAVPRTSMSHAAPVPGVDMPVYTNDPVYTPGACLDFHANVLEVQAGLPAPSRCLVRWPCLPARLPARPPARVPAARPPACPPTCLPARLPARLPACPPARLPACLLACAPALTLPVCQTSFEAPCEWQWIRSFIGVLWCAVFRGVCPQPSGCSCRPHRQGPRSESEGGVAWQ